MRRRPSSTCSGDGAPRGGSGEGNPARLSGGYLFMGRARIEFPDVGPDQDDSMTHSIGPAKDAPGAL